MLGYTSIIYLDFRVDFIMKVVRTDVIFAAGW